jgi:hypothetical protein
MTATASCCTPLRNRKAETLAMAIANIHETLSKGGCKPQFHRLDNECPQLVKDYLKQHSIDFQLAPPTRPSHQWGRTRRQDSQEPPVCWMGQHR